MAAQHHTTVARVSPCGAFAAIAAIAAATIVDGHVEFISVSGLLRVSRKHRRKLYNVRSSIASIAPTAVLRSFVLHRCRNLPIHRPIKSSRQPNITFAAAEGSEQPDRRAYVKLIATIRSIPNVGTNHMALAGVAPFRKALL
ncbi:hypothetical protein LZ31DRAFT_629682 [Colletotrichum somersetense]|nr:hypothetical protein LZ31DRAFT_629682 [Colletotrichum somersetense]